jgi:chitinase
MNSIFFLLITLIAFFGPLLAESEEYKVVGYYPNWGIYRTPSFKPNDINFDLVTHINYAFAKVDVAGNIHLFDSWADVEYRSDWNTEKPYWGNFQQLTEIKKRHPHIKTLISIGGWTLSDTFSSLAENPRARANFAESAIKFCKQYGFDGIDIDWEYPGFAEHSGRSQDKENFTLLLAELREAAKAENPSLLVTIAAPAGPFHYKNIEVEEIHPYLDWINLMTYDLHGPWGDSDNRITNHHSPLFPPAAGSADLSVYTAVQYYLTQGVPAKKLVIGMPLYGRVFANSNGLHTPYKGAGSGTTQEAGMRFFYDIKQNLLNTYGYFWDEQAQVPYLYNSQNKEFVTYENEESLRIKSKFIKQLGLGGAMVWELGLDNRPSWEALHGIVDELRNE